MPNGLRIGRSGATPAYIRAVSNTGRKPCDCTSSSAIGFVAGMSNWTGSPGRTREISERNRRSAVGIVREERADLAPDAAWRDHAISRQQPVTSYRQGRAPSLCHPVPHESTPIVWEEGRVVFEKLGCCLPNRTERRASRIGASRIGTRHPHSARCSRRVRIRSCDSCPVAPPPRRVRWFVRRATPWPLVKARCHNLAPGTPVARCRSR